MKTKTSLLQGFAIKFFKTNMNLMVRKTSHGLQIKEQQLMEVLNLAPHPAICFSTMSIPI